MARPNIVDMRAGTSTPYVQLGTTNLTGPGVGRGVWSTAYSGNPELEPWRATSVDLSLEKYFGKRSYVSGALFRKNLLTTIYNQLTSRDNSSFPVVLPPGVLAGNVDKFGPVMQPMNGKGGMIANPADLKGKTIGVQTATIHADYAQKYFKDSTVKVYDTADNHNADLVAGRIDYALLDSVAADDFAKANAAKGIEAKLIVPGDPIFGVGAGAGLRKGDAKLKDKLNAAIKAVRASGEYDMVAKKYFNFNIYGE